MEGQTPNTSAIKNTQKRDMDFLNLDPYKDTLFV